MRPRYLMIAVLVGLAALMAALVLVPGRHRPGHPPRPPAGMVAMPRPPDPGAWQDERFTGWADEIMPMHQAVRRALRRFDGKVLDITLVPGPPGATDAPALVYRIRILTRSRDVLDIRMDAFDGRFLELRGADLGAARRPRKDD